MVARIAAFLAFVAVITGVLTVLLTPYQFGTHTKETIRGMYDQPKNSMQVVFFGASNMLSAVSPTYLYEEYGINGYNCASSVQPTIVTYYLLKDLLRNQADSLKLVVIDPSMILRVTEGATKPQWGERVIVNMKPSTVKLDLIFEYAKLHDQNIIEQLLTIIKYHSRWKSLTAEDYNLTNNVSSSNYSHGEFIRYRANVENAKTAGRSSKTNGTITDTQDFDDAYLEAMWHEPTKRYLDKIVDLCKERGIDVLLVKTPRTSWNDEMHDSLAHLADLYGVRFFDLSTEDMMRECNLTYTYDFVDEKHPNIHGSEKITMRLGRYIEETYGEFAELSDDIKGAIQADVEKYERCREDGRLLLCDELDEYISLLDEDRYTVFLASKGDVSSIDDGIKDKLASLGFSKLKEIEAAQSYVGIVHNGKAEAEKLGSVGKIASIEGSYVNGQLSVYAKGSKRKKAKESFKVLSMLDKGQEAVSIVVAKEKVCEDNDGLNFAVYDNDTNELIDTSSFSAADDYKRTSDRL